MNILNKKQDIKKYKKCSNAPRSLLFFQFYRFTLHVQFMLFNIWCIHMESKIEKCNRKFPLM